MLLDTMCNTFGGVCFIALLVAILSAMLPKEASSQDADGVPDAAHLVEDERASRLARQRDELRAAITTQEEILQSSTTNKSVTVTEAELIGQIVDKDAAIRDLRQRLTAMEDELARLTTSTDYNKAEAERLRRLADQLRKELESAQFSRQRALRTPQEREMPGWRPVNAWFRQGRLHFLDNPDQVNVQETGYGEEREWRYTLRPGTGCRVDAAFFAGAAYSDACRLLRQQHYLRIYTDPDSFPDLCRLRDDLVKRGLRYNWHLHEGKELVFVYGTDERIQ